MDPQSASTDGRATLYANGQTHMFERKVVIKKQLKGPTSPRIVTSKGLQKKISDRYTNASEMRVAIQQFEHDRCTRPSHWTPSTPGNDAGAGVLTLVQLQDSDVLDCLQEHLFGNYIGYGGRDQKLSGTYSRLELKVAWRVFSV
jgi:hypothetical protein